MRIFRPVFIIVLLVMLPLHAATTEELQRDFTELRFGMFIHFSIMTFTGDPWSTPNQDVNMFNPTSLDCNQWADAAVSANMTFGILTSKHHDGFCLWDSAYTTNDVNSSPWKGGQGDVVREYVDAFRSRGLEPCLFYSVWDTTAGVGVEPVTPEEMNFIKGQLTELLTNYGDFKMLFLDGWSWKAGHKEASYQEIRELVKQLQPGCLLVDNTHLYCLYDNDMIHYEAGSEYPVGNTLPAMASRKINTTGGNDWFWSPDVLTATLMSVEDIVDDGLLYLEPQWCELVLNCPPNQEGLLDPNIVSRLAEVGAAWDPNYSRPLLPAQQPQMDHPVTPLYATATSGTASYAIDGLNDRINYTVWQSSNSLPQSVTIDLGMEYPDVNILYYVPKYVSVESEGIPTDDGSIESYRIYKSTDDTTYTEIASGVWSGDSSMKVTTFTPTNARYIRLEALSAADAYAAATEISVGTASRARMGNFLVVEDFDLYTDRDALTNVWKDGDKSGNNSGSKVYPELFLVHDGKSMKYDYNNTSAFNYISEVWADVCDLPSGIGSDWTVEDMKALVLYFCGQAGNDANEQVYVKLYDADDSNAKVLYDGDMNDIKEESWHEWNISLAAFTGVDLNDVNRITIGFGDGIAGPGDGLGTVYFDDIQLHPRRCILWRRSADFAKVDYFPAGYPYSGDCVINEQELEMMVNDWLAGDDIIPTTDPNIAGGLVLHYPMDEGTGVTTADASGNGLTGYLGGSSASGGIPQWVASPQGSYALDFNGVKDYVKCNNAASLNITAAITLAVWVKTGDSGNYDSNPYIQKGNTAYRIRHSADNEIEFTIRGGTTDYSATFPVDSSFNGVWRHLAGTFDGSHLKLYIDSVLKDTTDYAGTINTNFNWLGIGTNSVAAERYNGVLDEVRIYNRALDPNEIGWLATNGTGVLPLASLANLYDVAPDIINFKDFAMLADKWLEENLWP